MSALRRKSDLKCDVRHVCLGDHFQLMFMKRKKRLTLRTIRLIDLTAIEAHQPRDQNRDIKRAHNCLNGGLNSGEGVD